MDIREARCFKNWKIGVELKLYEFQHAQSPRAPTTLITPTAKKEPAPSFEETQWMAPTAWNDIEGTNDAVNSDNDWQHIDLDMNDNTDPTIVTPIVPRYKTAEPANIDGNTKIKPKTYQAPNTCTETETKKDPSAFMDARPGGPQQTQQQNMRNIERHVSAQLKKKATTSTDGQQALIIIADKLAKTNTKKTPSVSSTHKNGKSADTPRDTTKRRQSQKKDKNPRPTQKVKTANPLTKPVPATVQACKYGCAHGGLVEMKQMQPYDTKHYLGNGKYLHNKKCKDCNESIAALFNTSKRKAIFYYCQVDYNVEELTDESKTKAESPCASILCVGCYFQRDTNKSTTEGKPRRTSNRGRV
jgi:hypothetical protein